MNSFDISVIVPTYNDSIYLKDILNSLYNQTEKPKQIIVIDSSDDNSITSLVQDYSDLKITLIYKKIYRAYAGKSMNYGIKIANSEYIAFIDTKTIPHKDWLLKYKNELDKNNFDVIFGFTKFKSTTYFQELIRSTSYGNIGHETVPGTVIKKKSLLKIGGFYEIVKLLYTKIFNDKLFSFICQYY
jgi:cellulose synthase/poly-beta-1,6-N-acetylglucosamine synthase-like glycosyltransferase